MKKFTRILTLILALSMCFLAMACATPEDPTEDTTKAVENPTDSTVATETTARVDKNGYLLDNLPDDLNYGGNTIKVLHWKAERNEFQASSETQTGDAVDDAIIIRNGRIQDRLGVTLEFTEKPGNNANIANFVKDVETAQSSGETYDIIATYSRTAGSLSTKGLLYNLYSVDDSYIDFEMPWWPSTLEEIMSIGNGLYYVTGDASTNVLHLMYGIYYNKNLFDQREGLEYLYKYVDANEWTVDKVIQITTGTYNDLNGAGTAGKDLADFYGFCTIYYHLDAFYTGANLKLVTHTTTEEGDNYLTIADDFYSEKCTNLVQKLGAWLTTSDCCVSVSGAAIAYQDPFINGNALICQNRAYMADPGLKDVEWKYGIVPTPKFDADQEEYITIVGNPFTLYGIMSNNTETQRATAIIECWASEAYRNTTPALFETTMKAKYSEAPDDARMYEICRNTLCFDLGRIYSVDLSYMSEMPSKSASTGGGNWSSIAGGYKRPLTKAISEINASIKALNDLSN